MACLCGAHIVKVKLPTSYLEEDPTKDVFIKNKIKISDNLIISNQHKSFIVAEISANHSGSLNILKKTMLKAKQVGANAVKIQTYQAETTETLQTTRQIHGSTRDDV